MKRHASRALGSISGFDRVLFRGVLRSISYVQGLDWFMGNQRLGFKDFEGFVEKFSAEIKKRAEQIAQWAGTAYEEKDSCLPHLAYLERAQALMDRLVNLPWAQVLNHWAQAVNPWLAAGARPRLRSCYWTVRQGEYASDVMFRSPAALAEVYPALCRYALDQFCSPQVLRFLGRRTNMLFNGEVCSTHERHAIAKAFTQARLQ